MLRTAHVLSLSLLAAPFASAQEAPPGPAPELQKLAPLVGHWSGSGSVQMGPQASKWTAQSTYAWVLDGHFLQEDTRVVFDDMAAPMTFRAYHGWDRENGRYVTAAIDNGGEARLEPLHLLPDGTMVQLQRRYEQGLPYAERARWRVDGDAMELRIVLLTTEGPSATAVEGTLARGEEAFAIDWDSAAWNDAKPAPELQRLARSAGTYTFSGAMVMQPGAPATEITGTDTFAPVFGGTIFRGESVGEAEGMPGQWRGEVFWSFDAHRKCLAGVYVGNMGEVMTMQAWWAGPAELVSTFAGTRQGTPVAERMVLTFDDEGRAAEAVADTLVGTAAPYRSFWGSYGAK